MRSGLQTGMKKPPYGGLVHILHLGIISALFACFEVNRL